MKVSYRGAHELPPKMQEKLDVKFAKLSKLLERRGEKEAHVMITNERHLHKVEVTVQFYDHQLVGLGADADLFSAMTEAIDKLETQAVKTRAKWREKRREEEPEGVAEEEPETAVTANQEEVRIFRVNHHERRKPMTLEEALLEFDGANRDYLVYRDAERECVSVLVRRRDGNFDLIES